jgi:hypothetical protein
MRLKSLLEPYAPALVVTADTPEVYYLNTHYAERYQKDTVLNVKYLRPEFPIKFGIRSGREPRCY